MTQPRRVACKALAKRIADSLGQKTGAKRRWERLVGYQIAGDSQPGSEITLVTTGWLLQVLVNEPDRLNDYTHIILDEVHERDLDADFVSLVVKLKLWEVGMFFVLEFIFTFISTIVNSNTITVCSHDSSEINIVLSQIA